MDDFEAFRQKRLAEKKAKEQPEAPTEEGPAPQATSPQTTSPEAISKAPPRPGPPGARRPRPGMRRPRPGGRPRPMGPGGRPGNFRRPPPPAVPEGEQDAAEGWVDGIGPTGGPNNPKVRGFVLGRYARVKVDPSELQRPANMEKTQLADPPAAQRESVENDAAVDELEAQIQALEAKKRALQQERDESEIESLKDQEGIQRPKGLQRF